MSIRGKVTDVRLAYAQCDVVVCPSVLDSFCRVAAEAMVNGIPVVGSDLPPIRELLGDDEAGLVVPVKDPRAVAAAVERLVRDPQLRARLGAAGRERSAAYGPATVRTAFLELYGLPEPARVARRELSTARPIHPVIMHVLTTLPPVIMHVLTTALDDHAGRGA